MAITNNIADIENHSPIKYLSKTGGDSKKAIHMDEAISKTKFGLFNYCIIFLSGFTLHAVAIETVAIVYVIPVSECDLNLSTTRKGILGGATLFGVICSSHLWGFLADTKGRRRIIQPTLFIAALLSIVCSFATSFYVFTTLRFLNGFFISGSAANIFAYLGEFHNNNQRSRAIMGGAAIFSILIISMPLAAWLVINQDWQFYIGFLDLTYKPWRLYMVVWGIITFISALSFTFLPESPKFALSQGNQAAAYQILRKVHRWNNGKKSQFEQFEILAEAESIENKPSMADNAENHCSPLKSVYNQTAMLFRPPYLKPTILLCSIQFGTYFTSNGFFIFFAEIVNKMSVNLDSFVDDRIMMCDVINMKSTNTSTVEYGNLNDEACVSKLESSTLEDGVMLEIAFGVGSTLAGLLIHKVGAFPIIFFILFTCGLSGIGCVLINIPWFQIILFVWFLSCAISVNVVSSASVDLYPTRLRAMAISISLMFGRLGSVVGANTVALLLDDHCRATFYLSGSILIMMGVLAFFIPNIHKKVISSEQDKMQTHNPRLSILSNGEFPKQ